MTRQKRKEKKSTPFYKDKDFIRLQKEWYKKLDKTGFVDVERKRTSHERPLNERTGELAGTNLYYYKQKARLFAAEFFSLLGKFSYNRHKLPKIYDFCDKIAADYDVTLRKIKKLTKIDRIMLRLRSEAASYETISNYLRRHCAKGSKASLPLGRSGQAYSLFWVHTRMQKLLQIMKLWQLYELNHNNDGLVEEILKNDPKLAKEFATAEAVPSLKSMKIGTDFEAAKAATAKEVGGPKNPVKR